MTDPHLIYFEDWEFIRGDVQWLPMMPSDLPVKLDILRHQWGQPIYISGHPKALGRRDGDSPSYHNIDRHGLVMAADIQPDGIRTRGDAHAFSMLARECCFTGYGFYPHWHGSNGGIAPGFHVDVRRERKPGSAATWGFVHRNGDLVQVSLNDAIEALA